MKIMCLPKHKNVVASGKSAFHIEQLEHTMFSRKKELNVKRSLLFVHVDVIVIVCCHLGEDHFEFVVELRFMYVVSSVQTEGLRVKDHWQTDISLQCSVKLMYVLHGAECQRSNTYFRYDTSSSGDCTDPLALKRNTREFLPFQVWSV